MRFCPSCGTRLKLKAVRTGNNTFHAFACEKCGRYEKAGKAVAQVEQAKAASIKVVDEEAERLKTMPTIETDCPKCGHSVAVWWLLQTRGGDEPSTQFYRCTKCSHTWRHYA